MISSSHLIELRTQSKGPFQDQHTVKKELIIHAMRHISPFHTLPPNVLHNGVECDKMCVCVGGGAHPKFWV